jgi:casein kinase II subunit beta
VLADKFNLYGLRAVIPNYLECLSLILDKTGYQRTFVPLFFVTPWLILSDDDAEPETLQNAIDLYGMIHARYIITTRGLDMMVKLVHIFFAESADSFFDQLRKYQIEAFGTCPNVQCHNHPVVPVSIGL